MMKKICFFFVLINLFVFNVSIASVKITPLKEHKQIFSLLKEYKIYDKICEKYLDRYSVIEGIEYYDFDNKLRNDGVLVVLDILANNVVKIFNELKKIHFNIYSIHPTKLYKKKWNGSIIMPDDFNGTESFVCRKVEHTDKLSLHSFGIAIDVNFLQNPCVFIDFDKNEIQEVIPKNGVRFLNRSLKRKNKENQDIGKVDDKIVKIFKKYGYDTWGGYWDFPVDYQHFQVSNRTLALLLMYASRQDGQKIFDIHTKCINTKNKSLVEMADEKNIDLLQEYKKDSKLLLKTISSWCKVKKQK